MIARSLMSALRRIGTTQALESTADTSIPIKSFVDVVIDETYRGLLNREPDQVGRAAYRQLLHEGILRNELKIGEMLRSCVDSPEFYNLRATELKKDKEPLVLTTAEVNHIFKSFKKFEGKGRLGYVTNFLGCITDISVTYGIETLNGTVEDYPFAGNFHGGTVEWVGTLKAVLAADGAFRMLELGAGWGPWCAIGHAAAAQRGISDIKVIGVEGDGGHIEFMEQHFADNSLRPESYSIVEGVVGLEDGEALFPKAKDPSQVYGGAPSLAPVSGRPSPGVDVAVERVAAYSLERLMAELPIVDLIHCDIQGSELELFTHALDLVSRKVKRVVIGTHSWQIDRGLIGLFASHGWVLEGAEECLYRGGVLFGDGTQIWRNPELTS